LNGSPALLENGIWFGHQSHDENSDKESKSLRGVLFDLTRQVFLHKKNHPKKTIPGWF
jgi:hypothetical protein